MIKDNFASGLTFEELKATYPQHGLIYLSWHPALEQQLRLNGSDSMYLADFIHVNEMNDQAKTHTAQAASGRRACLIHD